MSVSVEAFAREDMAGVRQDPAPTCHTLSRLIYLSRLCSNTELLLRKFSPAASDLTGKIISCAGMVAFSLPQFCAQGQVRPGWHVCVTQNILLFAYISTLLSNHAPVDTKPVGGSFDSREYARQCRRVPAGITSLFCLLSDESLNKSDRHLGTREGVMPCRRSVNPCV